MIGGEYIPDDWRYKPSIFGGKDDDSYWTELLEQVDHTDLARLGKMALIYCNICKRYGKDY